MPIAVIESLDHEGRGLTRADGKAVFVEGALPGERVEYVVRRSRPSYEQAEAVRILKPSAQRVTPRCRHYGTCGGCSMQHLDADAQAARCSQCGVPYCSVHCPLHNEGIPA